MHGEFDELTSHLLYGQLFRLCSIELTLGFGW